MRCTMFPPILPSPTKPICVTFLLLDHCGESAQGAHWVISLQSDALRGQVELTQRFEVADRLRVLEGGEGVGRARYLHIVRTVVNQLQEASGLWAALVELAGGVQEARAVAERGGG